MTLLRRPSTVLWPWAALAALALAGTAHAARRETAPAEPPPLQLKDFAVQRPLTIPGHDGVVQLTLPADAYPQIKDAQLRDVRVFNARGEAVAFAWHTPAPPPQVADRQSATAIFPVHGPARQGPLTDDLEVSVTTRNDGTILAAHSRQPPSAASAAEAAPARTLQALILDLGAEAADESLRALLFEPPAQARGQDYRADLAVDISEDLKQWDRVATAPVLWLRGVAAQPGASPLVQDRVDLNGLVHGHPRYARIQWLHGEPALFDAVRVLRRKSVEVPVALEEMVLLPQPGPRHAPQDWVYSAPPALAARQVGLQMPEANTVLPAAIGGYQNLGPGRAPYFDSVTPNTFFRLTQGGQERISGLVAIAPRAQAEWVVHPLRPPAAAASAPPMPLSSAPRLVLRWQPATLVFAAQGPGPFVLALGAAPPWGRPADTELSQVAPGFSEADLQRLEVAQVGPATLVAVAARVTDDAASATPASPAVSRHLVLWAVLLVGFGVLSFMCWTLYRQMQRCKTPG